MDCTKGKSGTLRLQFLGEFPMRWAMPRHARDSRSPADQVQHGMQQRLPPRNNPSAGLHQIRLSCAWLS